MSKFNYDNIEFFLDEINEGVLDVKGGIIYKNDKPVGTVQGNGYLFIWHKNRRSYAHRILFAYYFGIDELKKYESVNHIDGNKLNNAKDNLEGMSLAENTRHQWETGLVNTTGSFNGQSKLSELDVAMIKVLLDAGFSQYKIASRFGVSRSAVLQIKLGNSWNHITDQSEPSPPASGSSVS